MILRIMGDSHTVALADGWDEMADEINTGNVEVQIRPLGSGKRLHNVFFDGSGREIRFTPQEYAENFSLLTGKPMLGAEPDIVYGFCMSYHTAYTVARPTWWKMAPWRVARQNGLIALSDQCVAQIAKAYARHSLSFFQLLKSRDINFFVIQAPPLKSDWRPLAGGLKPEVALEVDRLFREAISAELSAMDVFNVPPPKETIAETGFLKPDFGFSEDDPHHANAAYGKLVVLESLKILASRESGPRS